MQPKKHCIMSTSFHSKLPTKESVFYTHEKNFYVYNSIVLVLATSNELDKTSICKLYEIQSIVKVTVNRVCALINTYR